MRGSPSGWWEAAATGASWAEMRSQAADRYQRAPFNRAEGLNQHPLAWDNESTTEHTEDTERKQKPAARRLAVIPGSVISVCSVADFGCGSFGTTGRCG